MIAHDQSYSARTLRVISAYMAAIDETGIIAGLLGGCDFTPCDQAADSLFNHAVRLSALGREQEAIAAWENLIARLVVLR